MASLFIYAPVIVLDDPPSPGNPGHLPLPVCQMDYHARGPERIFRDKYRPRAVKYECKWPNNHPGHKIHTNGSKSRGYCPAPGQRLEPLKSRWRRSELPTLKACDDAICRQSEASRQVCWPLHASGSVGNWPGSGGLSQRHGGRNTIDVRITGYARGKHGVQCPG